MNEWVSKQKAYCWSPRDECLLGRSGRNIRGLSGKDIVQWSRGTSVTATDVFYLTRSLWKQHSAVVPRHACTLQPPGELFRCPKPRLCLRLIKSLLLGIGHRYNYVLVPPGNSDIQTSLGTTEYRADLRVRKLWLSSQV